MNRILIVDNDRDHLDVLAEVLSRDFDVVTANDGREAASLLQTLDGLTVALSDFEMPNMNGVEFLVIVRETRPEVFRAIMTGRIGTPTFDPAVLQVPEPDLVIPKPIASVVQLRKDLKGLQRP